MVQYLGVVTLRRSEGHCTSSAALPSTCNAIPSFRQSKRQNGPSSELKGGMQACKLLRSSHAFPHSLPRAPRSRGALRRHQDAVQRCHLHAVLQQLAARVCPYFPRDGICITTALISRPSGLCCENVGHFRATKRVEVLAQFIPSRFASDTASSLESICNLCTGTFLSGINALILDEKLVVHAAHRS